jgi:hypothetical protein
VYKKIQLLDQIHHIVGTVIHSNQDQVIVLAGNLPKYLINIYIASCYTGSLDLCTIDPMDMIDFLKFIDQYPTSDLQIDLMEGQLVEYIDKHFDLIQGARGYLMDICSKYRLKYLYLSMHNKKVACNQYHHTESEQS